MRALDVLELIAYVQVPVSTVCFPSNRLFPLYFGVLITVQRIHYTAAAALHQAKVVCQLATTLAMASPPSESCQRFDPHYKVYVNPEGKYVKKFPEFLRTEERSSEFPSGCEVVRIGSFKCGSSSESSQRILSTFEWWL